MQYEIINPSDPYVMDADDETVAIAACLFLGEGFYGLRRGEESVLGVLSFFPGAVKAIEAERFSGDLAAWPFANGDAIATALETVRMLDGRERSSLNDIGAHAAELAKDWRKNSKAKAERDGAASANGAV